MTLAEFQADIRAGIPAELPALQPYDTTINHAPKRKDILTPEEKKLALRNALRYFPKELHAQLAPEFAEELRQYDVVDEDGSDDDCKVCYLLHDYFLANLLNTTIRYPSTRNPPGASTNTSGM